MTLGGRFGFWTVGSALMLLAGPAVAQPPSLGDAPFGGFAKGLPTPPQGEPSLPPGSVDPLNAKNVELPAPNGRPLKADLYRVSTDLGFQQGIGPAPGRSISFEGHKYRVTDVVVKGGGPSFSGGSSFVIGVAGSSLMVGLKSIVPGSLLDPDRLEASAVN